MYMYRATKKKGIYGIYSHTKIKKSAQIVLKQTIYLFSFETTGIDDIVALYSRIQNPHSLQFFCYPWFDILTTDEKMSLWSKEPK